MNEIVIFTDGASKGNPGSGGYGAVIWMGDRVVERGGYKKGTTNNEMELKAVVDALTYVQDKKMPVTIYTDSKYVEQGATGWIWNWVKNGWQTKGKTDVLNRELWEALLPLLSLDITWEKISGHVNLNGNEEADRIASSFAAGQKVELYDGPKAGYEPKIEDLEYDKEAEAKRREARKRQGQKAYSYVSEVDGVVEVHTTWAECEARIKGKKARFKKALDADEEQAILKAFSK
ncbi:MAG: ribonuclease HI [Candidatus Pacebacteria bacterium]|nr:ribonuclease HI [Candidatus Paceibacterota bacterium]